MGVKVRVTAPFFTIAEGNRFKSGEERGFKRAL